MPGLRWAVGWRIAVLLASLAVLAPLALPRGGQAESVPRRVVVFVPGLGSKLEARRVEALVERCADPAADPVFGYLKRRLVESHGFECADFLNFSYAGKNQAELRGGRFYPPPYDAEQSGQSFEDVSVPLLGAWLEAYQRQQGETLQFVLVGHGTGGVIVVDYARQVAETRRKRRSGQAPWVIGVLAVSSPLQGLSEDDRAGLAARLALSESERKISPSGQVAALLGEARATTELVKRWGTNWHGLADSLFDQGIASYSIGNRGDCFWRPRDCGVPREYSSKQRRWQANWDLQRRNVQRLPGSAGPELLPSAPKGRACAVWPRGQSGRERISSDGLECVRQRHLALLGTQAGNWVAPLAQWIARLAPTDTDSTAATPTPTTEPTATPTLAEPTATLAETDLTATPTLTETDLTATPMLAEPTATPTADGGRTAQTATPTSTPLPVATATRTPTPLPTATPEPTATEVAYEYPTPTRTPLPRRRGPTPTLLPVLGERIQQIGPAGQPANGGSYAPAVSADGQLVAFTSEASNLVAGDANEARDVFVKHRATGLIERVSVSASGLEAGLYAWSDQPGLSADGRFVVFTSVGSLVPGDTNSTTDVYLRDRQSGILERISLARDGAEPNDRSYNPALSADGRFVAFTAVATNLVPGDTNEASDVFIRDRQTGQLERVSTSASGAEGGHFGWSDYPALSLDGGRVAFISGASGLVPGDTNETIDIFVKDRATGHLERVSVGADGSEPLGASYAPALSADGRFVAFTSEAPNLVPNDTNEVRDIFLKDRLSGGIERVSVGPDGAQSQLPSWAYPPAISQDGRYVAFLNGASSALPDDMTDVLSIFVKDRQTGAVDHVGNAADGTQYDGAWLSAPFESPELSADGRYVAFTSDASNLVPNDVNGTPDVFLVDRLAPLGR